MLPKRYFLELKLGPKAQKLTQRLVSALPVGPQNVGTWNVHVFSNYLKSRHSLLSA